MEIFQKCHDVEPVEHVGTWNAGRSRFCCERKEGHGGPQWVLDAGVYRPSSVRRAIRVPKRLHHISDDYGFRMLELCLHHCSERPNGRGAANEAIAVDSPMRPGPAYRERLSR